MRALLKMNGRSRLKRRGGVFGMLCAVTLLVTSACSLGPEDLPSVRGGSSGGLDLTLKFSSVMNLPTGADVMMNGLRLGQVERLKGASEGIDVRVSLDSDTQIPTSTRAIVRQDTLLGDTYVALVPPAGSFGSNSYLHDGGVVPIAQTTSPPQLEDTMAVLAYFVNGGSIQKMQTTMATVNDVMPQLADVQKLADVTAIDLRDLAKNTDEIDRFLDGFDGVATSFQDRSDELQQIFAPSSSRYWNRWSSGIVTHMSKVVPSIGSIFQGGMWLVPMLNSLANSGDSVRMIWDKGPATAVQMSDFIQTTLLPFAQKPSVNVKSVQVGNTQITADVENLLRMLGAVK